MLDQLLEQYQSKKSQLVEAVERDRPELLSSVDRELTSVFKQILAYVPETKSDRVKLCKFLLDAIDDDEPSPHRKRICNKIIQLVEAKGATV